MSTSRSPEISFSHRSRAIPYDASRVEAVVLAGLPHCLAADRANLLSRLDVVEISIVGARTMARVHREFLGIAGATDVITFPYGEIVVCAQVAAERAPEFGKALEEEIALYAIHGLLHLAGHDDIDPSDARRMHRAQERILRKACDKIAGPRSASRTL